MSLYDNFSFLRMYAKIGSVWNIILSINIYIYDNISFLRMSYIDWDGGK